MKNYFTIITLLLAFSYSHHANCQGKNSSELVKTNWPKEDSWHVADEKKSAAQTMTEMLKGKETFDNFTELLTTHVFRGSMYVPVTEKIDELYKRVKNAAPTAKKTMIEKDEKANCPWYIYKIESPTESQVWFAVQRKK